LANVTTQETSRLWPVLQGYAKLRVSLGSESSAWA
jgi:hypothetical protein